MAPLKQTTKRSIGNIRRVGPSRGKKSNTTTSPPSPTWDKVHFIDNEAEKHFKMIWGQRIKEVRAMKPKDVERLHLDVFLKPFKLLGIEGLICLEKRTYETEAKEFYSNFTRLNLNNYKIRVNGLDVELKREFINAAIGCTISGEDQPEVETLQLYFGTLGLRGPMRMTHLGRLTPNRMLEKYFKIELGNRPIKPREVLLD